MDHTLNEHELHLYVDGHLDEARRAAVEVYLLSQGIYRLLKIL